MAIRLGLDVGETKGESRHDVSNKVLPPTCAFVQRHITVVRLSDDKARLWAVKTRRHKDVSYFGFIRACAFLKQMLHYASMPVLKRRFQSIAQCVDTKSLVRMARAQQSLYDGQMPLPACDSQRTVLWDLHSRDRSCHDCPC